MGDTGRNSKAGKSKKPGKIKKKKQLGATDVSSEHTLEKRKEDKPGVIEDEVYQITSGDEDYSEGMKSKSKKPGNIKKKRQLVATNVSSEHTLEKIKEDKRGDIEDEVYQMSSGDEDYSKGMKSKSKNPGKIKKKKQLIATDVSSEHTLEKRKEDKHGDREDEVYQMSSRDEDYSKGMKSKSKKRGKIKKKSQLIATDVSSGHTLEKRTEDNHEDIEDEVYQMSSGDEDYSNGVKKWITEYHQSRPGLKVLQERIDDFIVAHEAKEERAKAEREAQAAEGGWTVVVHHKGRKKTTDAESGVAVGSVAQAAVLDNMVKKKKKEVGLDFYRFQKKEAHRNEIMMLQSKFEQDKKQIQQMRAARKFRPY